MQAALRGSREIGFTIISMTLSLAAVFIPVLFMSGILGRLLHEFAVTIGVAILVSGFVSLSLTPMLCSRFLRPPKEQHHNRVYQVSERFFEGMLRVYDRSLQFVMRHRLATMGVLVLVLIGTAYLFITIPKGFLPSEDTGQIFMMTEAQQGISYDSMRDHQLTVISTLLKSPDGKYMGNFMSAIGSLGPMGTTSNQGRMFIRMGPRSERPSVDQIIQDLRPQLAQIPGINAYLQNPPPIRIGAQISKAQYQFTLQSPDKDLLYEYAPKLEAAMRKIPGLQDVTSDLQVKNPQINIDIDRDKAATLGVTANQIEDALYSAYCAAPDFQYLRFEQPVPRGSGTGRQVPDGPRGVVDALRALVIRTVGAAGCGGQDHQDSGPAFGEPPGTIAGRHHLVQPAAGRLLWVMRSRRSTRWRTRFCRTPSPPASRALPKRSSPRSSGLGLLLIMAILVIYIVLGILYESFIHPLTILSGLPSAGFGALLTLLVLFHRPPDSVRPDLWLRRHHHAGRHREKERHHDDRLRPGGPAQGREERRGGHLSGLPGPLPPHHDDHHGRPHGHPAHRPRLRRGSASRGVLWAWPWSAACSFRSCSRSTSPPCSTPTWRVCRIGTTASLARAIVH